MDEWRNGETLNGRGTGVPAMREGDIVITRVAHHYSLGRISADNQTQTSLESHDHRAEAIRRACAVAGADQQVFIYEEAESTAHVLVNCETLAGAPNNSIFTAVDLSLAPGGPGVPLSQFESVRGGAAWWAKLRIPSRRPGKTSRPSLAPWPCSRPAMIPSQ